ncbi:hypothetical protein D3C86_2103450 [compost metagenome]
MTAFGPAVFSLSSNFTGSIATIVTFCPSTVVIDAEPICSALPFTSTITPVFGVLPPLVSVELSTEINGRALSSFDAGLSPELLVAVTI